MTQKLYAYVDESGQDTEGRFFVVSVAVVGPDHDDALRQIEAIELRSRKGHVKWHRARHSSRQTYIDELMNLDRLSGCIFFSTFEQSRYYTDLTAEATSRAIRHKARGSYKVTIFVDGLRKSERRTFATRLRARRVRPYKVRGVLKEENNAMIRLADAICGLVRDAEDGQDWAMTALRRLARRGLIIQA